MPSLAARVKALEKQVAGLKKEVAKQKKEIAKSGKATKALQKANADAVKWISRETNWSKEVTAMLQGVNWAALETAYPGGGGGNPPQPPPDWPVSS